MAYRYYILHEDHSITYTNDVFVWAEWAEMHKDINLRRVGLTKLFAYDISTVFLGIDHQFFGDGPPMIFETMVFYKDWRWKLRCKLWLMYLWDKYKLERVFPVWSRWTRSLRDPSASRSYWFENDIARYSTWDEAVAGHKAMVKKWRKKQWKIWTRE